MFGFTDYKKMMQKIVQSADKRYKLSSGNKTEQKKSFIYENILSIVKQSLQGKQ